MFRVPARLVGILGKEREPGVGKTSLERTGILIRDLKGIPKLFRSKSRVRVF